MIMKNTEEKCGACVSQPSGGCASALNSAPAARDIIKVNKTRKKEMAEKYKVPNQIKKDNQFESNNYRKMRLEILRMAPLSAILFHQHNRNGTHIHHNHATRCVAVK